MRFVCVLRRLVRDLRRGLGQAREEHGGCKPFGEMMQAETGSVRIFFEESKSEWIGTDVEEETNQSRQTRKHHVLHFTRDLCARVLDELDMASYSIDTT